MKAFIVYVKGNEKSEYYANYCLDSCRDKFDAELFEGVTPNTLQEHEKVHPFDHISPSRAENFKQQNKDLYQVKKSCFMNHVRIWHKCIELQETIAFVEQDSFCVRAWDNQNFDDIMILNYDSAFDQKVFNHLWKTQPKPTILSGCNRYIDTPLVYTKNNAFYDNKIMPGTAAYAVTPLGAEKLLTSLEKYGWEQSDFFINTHNVNIDYYHPEYFTFKLPNLNMSHGNLIIKKDYIYDVRQ